MNGCEWLSLRTALARFVTFGGATQSQRHIKPLHWYVACRLVVEGGFEPDEIPIPAARCGSSDSSMRSIASTTSGSSTRRRTSAR